MFNGEFTKTGMNTANVVDLGRNERFLHSLRSLRNDNISCSINLYPVQISFRIFPVNEKPGYKLSIHDKIPQIHL